jgi:cold shock CspA family protein
MHTGTIKWFDARTNGFGFIVPDIAGPDIFVHSNSVPMAILFDLKEGTRVRFRSELDRKGRPRVSYVELAEPFSNAA